MLETAVRSQGATPATIAVVNGRFKVGLTRDELERLARLSGGVTKASRRDLAAVAARHGSAGTTVAATMYVADLAGIEIFATGGIGGVHRGAEETFDISADLVELARTKVAVVCAGAKSTSTSTRRSNISNRMASPSAASAATNSRPSTPARAASSSTTAATACTTSPASSGCSANSAPGAADRQPDSRGQGPRRPGDRSAHRRSGRRSEGQGNRQEGSDAVPARPRRRADRRPQPRSQHGAGREQRDSAAQVAVELTRL